MTEPTDGPIDRGAWSGDDQKRTALAAWPLLPDDVDESSDVDRAIKRLALTVLARMLNNASKNDPLLPSIVLIGSDWRKVGRTHGWTYVPAIDDGSTQLTGYVFIVPSNLGAAYAFKLPNPDLGQNLDWLESELHLGDLPAIVFNPEATVPELKIYDFGLCKPNRKRSYPLYLAELNLDLLDDALERFWNTVVCAPGGGRTCEKLWKQSGVYEAVVRPEKILQREMLRFLRPSFSRLRIKDEENVPLGRLDIRISGPAGPDEYVYVNHAVIELKALIKGNQNPPFTDTEKIKTQVEEGVQQAASYRKPPEKSRIAMLACYDMRPHSEKRGETCFDHVLNFAATEEVELRRWPLFPSVSELRKFNTPSSSANP